MRFAHQSNISVAQLYLPHDDRAVAGQRFDTTICLNVLEHVEDDIASLTAGRTLLEPKGRLVLLVPALPALYASSNRAVCHQRRYTPADPVAKRTGTGFLVL